MFSRMAASVVQNPVDAFRHACPSSDATDLEAPWARRWVLHCYATANQLKANGRRGGPVAPPLVRSPFLVHS